MNTIFDDFLFKAKDVADAAAKKTGELCELSKYKLESVKINNEIKSLYEELGSAAYTMVKEEYVNNELILSLAEEIDELMLRLDAVTEKIDEMKKVVRCTACGAKNSPENVYCAHCGARLRSDFSDDYNFVDEDENADETQA